MATKKDSTNLLKKAIGKLRWFADLNRKSFEIQSRA